MTTPITGPRVMGADGPLLFALAVPGRREITRTYDVPDRSPSAPKFVDVVVHPVGRRCTP